MPVADCLNRLSPMAFRNLYLSERQKNGKTSQSALADGVPEREGGHRGQDRDRLNRLSPMAFRNTGLSILLSSSHIASVFGAPRLTRREEAARSP